MSDDLFIRGSLEESSVAQLLRSVAKSRETGVLTCFIEENMKSVYIRDGQILFAHSSNLDERLGELLLEWGRITYRQFQDASNEVRPGRRLGAILCDMHALSPEELVDSVRKQVRTIILSMFEATRGRYELNLKDVNTQEMILLNMSTEDIIFNGVKTIRSWTRISKGIGSFTSRVSPSAEAAKILLSLTMTQEESDLYTMCEKGQFTVEDICSVSYLSNFETCRVIWAFVMAGLLELKESRATTGAPAAPAIYTTSADFEYELHDLVEKYNDLYSHIYDHAYNRDEDRASAIAAKAMERVRETMPSIARDLALDSYGRLDFDAILKNLAPIPEAGRKDLVAEALEELVYSLLFEIGAEFGADTQKELTREIQKMRSQ